MANLLHDLISISAVNQPNSIAIQEKNRSTSYAELDLITNGIANLLAEIGELPGQRIGLLVDKSIEAYQGIYAILKSGCAYVPLDKQAPAERLAYICSDCQIHTLLVTSKTWAKLKSVLACQSPIKNIVVLDEAEAEAVNGIKVFFAMESATHSDPPKLSSNIVDSDLAYILYTSGSTGKPKGVMISHHVSMSFVTWASTQTTLRSQDRVSGHAPLHFDLSIFDIFATAKVGGTLLPVPDGASTFPSRLLDWMINNKISVWYSVPSILSMMTQNSKFRSETYPDLRLVIFAGEVFPVPYLKQWLDCLPDLTFMNWFGPTETNVITCYTVALTAEQILSPIPIGSSTDNASLYCLDTEGNLITEPGQKGELYARGPCTALGYWGDDKKTKERFLENSQTPYLKDRTFKTGDIVSLDDNGDYIYLGRNDHLVKSRGYRIELGEIEAAYYQQDMVKEVAIIPFADDLIGNKLVAFAVTVASSCGGALEKYENTQITKLISKILPSYMIPASTEIMSSLPKTSNGKIDRQKLTKKYQNKLS